MARKARIPTELKFLPRLFMAPVPRTQREWRAVDGAGVPHFIVFARDFRDASGLLRLNARLITRAAALGALPLLALDEEGGLVSQLKTLDEEAPGPRVLARAGDLDLARASARATARALRSLGFNLNFAPVADVDSARANPVIGARAVGPDPGEVGDWCASWIESHQSSGVAATAKHFPGHGDATSDSHLTLPVVRAARALLKRRELRPFLDAVSRGGVAAVMTAHVRYPAVDPRRPATLSPRILQGLLRGLLGFRGLVVSDSMDMAGVRRVGDAAAAVQAMEAGCDLLLYGLPGTLWQTGLEAVERAARSGRLTRERLEEALTRVEAVARAFPAKVARKPAFASAGLRRRWDRALEGSLELRGALPAAAATAAAGTAAAGTTSAGTTNTPGAVSIRVAGDVPQAALLASELRRLGLDARPEPPSPETLPGAANVRRAGGHAAQSAARASRSFVILVIPGRRGWEPAELRMLDRWQAEGREFGLISLLSPTRLDEPPASGARLLACPFEDTHRAVRALAARIAATRPAR